MPSELQIKKDIVEVGRRLYRQGLVAAGDGNISVRVGENRVLATPHGVSKGFMTVEMITTVDLEGRMLAGSGGSPSSEMLMHLDVYRNRPDVRAVVHAHPPTATGFAVAGLPLSGYSLTEIIVSLGTIPLCDYATPSTREVADSVRPHLDGHDAFLLANHGALTVGVDVFDALFKMEAVEHCARITLTARQLGGEKQLSPAQVERLLKLGKRREPGA